MGAIRSVFENCKDGRDKVSRPSRFLQDNYFFVALPSITVVQVLPSGDISNLKL